MSRRNAEVPMSFQASLPPAFRSLCWLPMTGVLLTLPDLAGAYTVFTTHRCPQHGLLAHNVATYVRNREVIMDGLH